MPSKGFRSLRVYVLAAPLGDELRRSVASWDAFDRGTLGYQAVKAADSVGANIAEGMGRRRTGERLHHLFIARGSALELQHWIERMRERDLPHPSDLDHRTMVVSRMLNGLISSIKTKDERRKTKDV